MNTSNGLAEYFIDHAPRFYEDLDLQDIDEKHVRLLKESYREVERGSAFSRGAFRNWKGQNDMAVPAQMSLNAMRARGLTMFALKYVYSKLLCRDRDRYLLSTFQDDMEIIKSIGGEKLLLDNPVHLTPNASFSFSIAGTSVNQRWLRYIYVLKRILDFDLLEKGGVWVDVGSYYGGLQGLVHKYNPKAKIVMVDFHHQLCRSFIYLSKLYPDAKHVMPDELFKYEKLNDVPEGSFVYIPVSDYECIADQTVDLVSNFFSFGEMRKEFFYIYLKSRLFSESKRVYLVNRFVSAPFFESTYDSDLSVLNYISREGKIEYFDIFPIHHYMLIKRDVFGRKEHRNISSPYFEMVTSGVASATFP